MPERVTIPVAILDYSSDYVRPVISIWLDRANLVQSMFDALAKWSLSVDNVEGITTGKPSEQGLKYRIPEKNMSFFYVPLGSQYTRVAIYRRVAEASLELTMTIF